MLFPMSCKYCTIWLCHTSLFQKTELLLRDQLFKDVPIDVPDNGTDVELSTAYSIINQHNGSIRRERVAGHGTTITVYLPLASLHDAAQNALSAPEIA